MSTDRGQSPPDGPDGFDPLAATAAELSDTAVRGLIGWARDLLEQCTPIELHRSVRRILDQLCTTLAADSAHLLVYSRSLDALEPLVTARRDQITPPAPTGPLLVLGELPWLAARLRGGQGFAGMVHEVPDRPELEAVVGVDTQAVALAPLLTQGALVGVLVVTTESDREWPTATPWVLQLLASVIAELAVAPPRETRLGGVLLATLSANPELVMVVYDAETSEGVLLSESLCTLVGADPDAFARNAATLAELVHADDRAAVLLATDTIEARARRYRWAPELAEPVPLQLRLVDAAGNAHWIRGRFELVSEPGRLLVAGVGHLVEAPTPTLSADSSVLGGLLPSFVESADTIVALYDPVANEGVYISSAYERITGRSAEAWKRGEDGLLEGVHPEDFTRDATNAFLLERLGDVAAGRRSASAPFHHTQLRMMAADWSEHLFDARLFPVQHAGRWMVGILVTDVTEERKLQAERDAALAKAQEALATRDRFIARLSHELVSPLNAVMGWLNLAQSSADPEQALRLQRAEHAGTRLVELVGDVLELGELRSGVTPHLEPVRVADALDDVLALLEPAATAGGVDLVVERSALEEAPWVLGTRRRLVQVLTSLVSNAIKFSPRHGSVELQAAVHPGTGDTPGTVRITVRDHGPGVDPSWHERMFQPFERLDADRRGVAGTGLGLTLARELAESMHATLIIDADVTEGACFVLVLEACAPYDPTGTELPTAPRPAGRVLCVEDDPGSRQLLGELVGGDPRLTLELAPTVQDALARSRQHRPDVVLTDLYLPDATGVEVIERLRDEPCLRDVPIVVMSADRRQQVLRAVTAAGAVAFWAKPLEFAELTNALVQLLD